ncbi:L,D-transpeptidase [Clostridium sp.]|uniref:L,D-transpeptidase n=1 Tax=Clostridium sp. TaxID=1506 RepID=UPI002FC669B7
MNTTTNNKKSTNLSLFRFFIICLLFIFLAFGANTYVNYNYNNKMNEFYSAFNKYDFDTAISIVNNTRESNILKRNQLNKDLNLYFTGIVNTVIKSIQSEEISDENIISLLYEIKKYDVLNDSLDKLIASLDSNYVYKPTSESTIENYSSIDDTKATDNDPEEDLSTNLIKDDSLSLGISSFNDKDYPTAISYFNKIPKSSLDDFNVAQDYILNCQKNYKTDLLADAEELIANKYYTDAIAFLSSYDTSILSSNDKDIANKINSVEMFRDEYNDHIQSYPNDNSAYASAAILQTITMDNINTLNIESPTPYLVYLSLTDQTTYIYEGSTNNWTLSKSFLSSTGLPGKETPKGIFSISGRDEWFFAQEFQQGGKYWVRFMGDYLFHSLPFNETQSTIVDETLGVPASHGCVRLEIEDSKWIYDNIDDGTKVIIN